ncbi:hypothetical protein ACFX13_020607 [Malus domestica]
MKSTKSESLAYLREVKEVFAKQGKIENFHHFVQLLQDSGPTNLKPPLSFTPSNSSSKGTTMVVAVAEGGE